MFLFKHFKKELNTLERVKNEYMRKNNEQVLQYILLTSHQVIKLPSLKPFVDECEDKPEV